MNQIDNSHLPLVSVVMPAYNAGQYIGKAIESVLNQTYSNWELLIIDDASSDDSYDVAFEYTQKDKRIKLYQNEKNMGVARTRNFAIQEAMGEYVAFLDSDDIWMSTKLEKQIDLIKKNGSDLVYTSYALVNEIGEDVFPNFIVPEQVDYKLMLTKNVIGCSTVLLRSQIAKNFLFNLDYYHEDYILWLECLQAGYKANGIKEVLVKYRVYANSKAGNKKKSAVHRYQIYRKYLKMTAFKSHIVLFQYAINGLMKYKKK